MKNQEVLCHWNEDSEHLFASKEEAIDDAVCYNFCPTNGKIKLYAYTRMDVHGVLTANKILEFCLGIFDEEYGSLYDYSESTKNMEIAAQALVDVIEKEYFIWACERSPKLDEIVDFSEGD